ncbi:ubiquinol-cytochrome C chaperone [Nordella sp. HKS 07]|uniref:ubiquinol-cytochrome C chaperone family protein n=1 Tax=Nordella sp. HKS 07 TaxID=2712222 RepID=UPI0013E14AC1|nr:ubiquinol-cytochrome C chaperone family protein [Nordella sp. HKS 07]QIG50912.1 ubiquinol-cytochrome C chaperone [Nordella sp. HKS 07]
MILSLFKRKASRNSVRAVYGSIVAAARHAKPYAEWGVPDSVDGRYDMIILHAVLVLDRLGSAGPSAQAFAQGLTDEVFADMDRSLREMGVGDLSVGKKVRRMAEIFYGRAQVYRPLLQAGDQAGLAEALGRNVFAGTGTAEGVRHLAAYALAVLRHLQERPIEPILSGQLDFPEP